MKLGVLGSGSAGNCAVVIGPGGPVLVDAGLSARQILSRLGGLGIAAESLCAVLLTHEHGDHTRGLDVLLRDALVGVPVYCNHHTCQVLRPGLRHDKRWRLIETGGTFEIAGLRVETFSVPHDAVDPIGFVIESSLTGSRLGIVSDLGHPTSNVLLRLRDLDAAFLEANYCPTRLANDTRRPWATKQRIASRHGHLSNDQAAELAAAIASPRLRHLLIGHLSQDCNDPATATAVISAGLARRGFGGIEIMCALQDDPVSLFPVLPPPGFLPEPIPRGPEMQPELFT
jgi:phosphoribosyl 1,2-cyclic phosphodiesterase